jgi:hypothetical protein
MIVSSVEEDRRDEDQLGGSRHVLPMRLEVLSWPLRKLNSLD